MEDDRLVQLALTRGYVTAEQIDRARTEQRTLADRGIDHGVYFLLQDLGFLSESDARELRRSVSSSAIRALEVDGFTIQGRLGSGGMGDVFRAGHPDGRMAAVKLLSAKLARSEEYVRRFLREARAMSRLVHPHIVRVLGCGESLGTRYILMELVEGPSLKAWIVDRKRLEPEHALLLLRQMAAALGHAWQHGVLHRDVKPANILLGPPRPGTDETFCAKLCDFGLARLGPDPAGGELSRGGLTGTGLALGTPHYMSPEQASGEHDVDQRADIYGLGATLYHALLGQTLYSGKSSAVIMYKQVTEAVDLQLLRQAGVGEPLVMLLGRMLEKRRSARIATWAEVLGALDAFAPAPRQPPEPPPISAPVPALPPPPPPSAPPARPPRPRLLKLVALSAVVAALVAATAVGLLLSRPGTTTVGPQELSAALADHAAGRRSSGDLVLTPGTYSGPIRLGAAHRGLHLRAAGAGVILDGGGGPAVICEPGLGDARLAGLTLRSTTGPALETVGGCDLRLEDAQVEGGLRLGGGVVSGLRLVVSGLVQVADRGALDLVDSTVAGSVEVDRGDLRLRRSHVQGQVQVRAGSLIADAVRIDASLSPALTLSRCQAELTDVQINAVRQGAELRAVELSVARGLTITGPGPSLVWNGERQAEWAWERFELSSPPQGLPGTVPAGPGADARRLP